MGLRESKDITLGEYLLDLPPHHSSSLVKLIRVLSGKRIISRSVVFKQDSTGSDKRILLVENAFSSD